MARMDSAGNVTVMTGFLSTVQGFSGSAQTKAGKIAWSVQNSDAATGPVNLVTAIGTAVVGVHTSDNLVKADHITATSNTNQAFIKQPGTVLTNKDALGNTTQTFVPTVLPTVTHK